MAWKDILKSFSPSPQYLYQHVYNDLFNFAYEKLEEKVEERIKAEWKGKGRRGYVPNPNSEVIEQKAEALLEDKGLGPESLNDAFETYQKKLHKGNELISLDRKKDIKDLTNEEYKTLDGFMDLMETMLDYQIKRIW